LTLQKIKPRFLRPTPLQAPNRRFTKAFFLRCDVDRNIVSRSGQPSFLIRSGSPDLPPPMHDLGKTDSFSLFLPSYSTPRRCGSLHLTPNSLFHNPNRPPLFFHQDPPVLLSHRRQGILQSVHFFVASYTPHSFKTPFHAGTLSQPAFPPPPPRRATSSHFRSDWFFPFSPPRHLRDPSILRPRRFGP